MILIHGQIKNDCEQAAIIESMGAGLYATLAQGNFPRPETVIRACDRLLTRVLAGEFDHIVLPLLKQFDISRERFAAMAQLFSADSLREKCRVELGDWEPLTDAPHRIGSLETDTHGEGPRGTGIAEGSGTALRRRYPLGVLMHIAAGNVDGLPAYSVVEGLLAGNINILKLPSGDSGLSVMLLSELIAAEPSLADYIYVFDVPSTETVTLTRLADYADAVVVWGGDAAVSAARSMVPVNTKIIAWGHKLSFAYATPDATDDDLRALARHICETDQVLCSSCQGIFVDTDDRAVQLSFAERFLTLLQEENRRAHPVDLGMKAKNAIHLYNERLEAHETGHTILSGGGVSVICADDGALELSYMFRNLWVKRLPRERLVSVIKPHKDHVQTVGLLCPDARDRADLAALLARAGAVRITRAGGMSRMLLGEAHDGAYALKLYSRIVEVDED